MRNDTELRVAAEISRLAPEWEPTLDAAAKAIVAGDRDKGKLLFRLATEMAIGTCPYWWSAK